MPLLPLLLIAAVLAAMSALLSSIETALFSLQDFEIKRLHERNPRLARALEALMENPRRTLSALLLADAVTNLPLILLCLYLMRVALHVPIPFWAVALTLFALVVLLCDLLPKMFALGQPYRVAQVGVAVLRVLMPALDPISRILQSTSERIADAVTPAKFRPNLVLTEEELETLVELSAEEGGIGGD